MYQSHNKSFCSASVMAGSVVLHSTLASRELSSSCSNPPSSANHRCSDPSLFAQLPYTLHSANLDPSLRRTDNLRSSSSRSSNCAGAATPHLPFVELQLPSVKAADHSTERRTATSVHLLVEQILPIPLRTFNTREATTRRTAHVIVHPKHHLV
jgi:hypothetical protein